MKTAIMCVDDELVVLHSLEMQLREHFGDHHILEFAETAEEAFEVIDDLHSQDAKVLAIVSDWLMPGMHGDEFLLEIHRRFPRIATIMLTGHADASAIQRVEDRIPGFRLVAKPWEAKLLASVLDESLLKINP